MVTKRKDFVGQADVKKYYHWIVNSFAFIGFCGGFVLKNFNVTAGFVFVGFLVSLMVSSIVWFLLTTKVCLPPWPMLRAHPFAWKDPQKLKEANVIPWKSGGPPASGTQRGLKR
jgi:hypothetical protein